METQKFHGHFNGDVKCIPPTMIIGQGGGEQWRLGRWTVAVGGAGVGWRRGRWQWVAAETSPNRANREYRGGRAEQTEGGTADGGGGRVSGDESGRWQELRHRQQTTARGRRGEAGEWGGSHGRQGSREKG